MNSKLRAKPLRAIATTALALLVLVLWFRLPGVPVQGRTAVEPVGPSQAGAIPPRLFFTDLESGPNTGGQDDLGAFVTLWGEGFGAARGSSTVTVGGIEVARYVIWGENNAVARSMDMIVVQLGPNVMTGNVVVTVGGQASNPLPFTVRPGNIYFVVQSAPNANDANAGTFEAPFKTIYRPREVMQPGDIVYIRGGTFSTADPEYPGWDTILLLTPDSSANGTAGRPIAYVGYPGDRPVLGSPTLRRGILMDEAIAYLIIANLELSQYAGMLSLSGDWHRIVGNYLHDGVFSEGVVIGIIGNTAHLKIFGNLLRDNGGTGDAAGHGLYVQGFGTNQDIDFGWNQIRNQRGRRAIQLFGHAGGDRMDNIRIHDNLISGSLRENILLGGSDGGTEVLGTIYVYNNIIVDADDQGLRINDPQGTVIIQNNVFHNNGSSGFDGNAQLYIERAGIGRITLQNNIVYAEPGQTYFRFGPGADSSVFSAASHNLCYNAGECPAWNANGVSADPRFVDVAAGDFRLSAGSPAVDAGATTGAEGDYNGIRRPQGAAYDIGAHERASGGAGVRTSLYLPLALRSAGQATTPTPSRTPTATPTTIAAATATATPTATSTTLPGGAVTLVALGDSLTEGDGDELALGGYPGRLLPQLQALRPGSTATNLGHSGWDTVMLINGNDGTPSQLSRAVTALNAAIAGGRVGIATVWIGSNDLWYLYNGHPDDATGQEQDLNLADYTANIDTILSQLRATGATVLIALLDDQSLRPVAANPALRGQNFQWISAAELPLMSQQVTRYNTAIANRAAQHGASTVDFYNTTIFTNPGTLNEDGNHPNAAGYDLITQLWLAAISPSLQ